MKLVNNEKKKMKLIDIKEKTSKKTGDSYTIITLADIENYVTYDFYQIPEYKAIDVMIGDLVIPTFVISRAGYNNVINLLKLEKNG